MASASAARPPGSERGWRRRGASPAVELYHWSPGRGILRGRLGRAVAVRAPTENFGDMLGPIVVRELLRRRGLDEHRATRTTRLLSVGSVVRVARTDDVVWGSGVNGKTLDAEFSFDRLDVRAVRGPLTRDFLRARGIDVPAVFGDPGLLVGQLWPREQLRAGQPRRALTVVPNLNDLASYSPSPDVVDPRRPVWEVVRAIASSEFVTGSSLHAVVLADSFGIPARLVRSGAEPAFKYDDYYRGSGRGGFLAARDVSHALSLGGEPSLDWDSGPLLDAFPAELWF